MLFRVPDRSNSAMTELTKRLQMSVAERYRIERHLGEGGTATVYLALDLKHDRRVAVKVLRPELAAVIGAQRFLAEIRTTANLQHPNILPLFDSGVADGLLFYVMPYVEGESLRQRLDREKQLPIDDVVRLGVEVANALDYAHRQGVVHRDIKPENILVHDGRALVTDFGIALAVSTAGGRRMTETGMLVGTPQYMSPEQATGDYDVTVRSDVYALGVTLYEALAGEPPFAGTTAQAIIARVMTEEPRPIRPQRKTIPAHVEAAVLKALARLPADRFSAAAEFGEALEGRIRVAPRDGPEGTSQIRGGRRVLLPLTLRGILVAGVAVGVLVAFAIWGWLRPMTAPTVRHQIVLDAAIAGEPGGVAGGAAIAPGGAAIAYVTGEPGQPLRLMVKERDEVLPHVLAELASLGVPGLPGPSFSPDGRWIAFADGRLERVSRGGGAPVVLSDAPVCCGTAWLDNGTIVSVEHGRQRLYATPASGGPTRTVLTADSASSLFQPVAPVPGRDAVLVGVIGSHPKLIALDLATGRTRLVRSNAVAGWVSGGFLLYTEPNGVLYAVRFDSRRLQATGTPVQVLGGIMSLPYPEVTLGRDGTLLYVSGPGAEAPHLELVNVGLDGSVAVLDTTLISGSTRSISAPGGSLDLSPDGRRIAVSLQNLTAGRSDIYILDLEAGIPMRLTFDGQTNIRPQWSPTGSRIMYVSDRGEGGTAQLWSKRADGGGSVSPVASDPRGIWGGLWSPDERWVVYRTNDAAAGNGDIVAISAARDSPKVPLVATRAKEYAPAISPDGRWLAYTSNANGPFEVFVQPFPDANGAEWQVSAGPGYSPQWSHDGSKLFYWSGSPSDAGSRGPGPFMEASVTTSPTFAVNARTALFSNVRYATGVYQHAYAVAPDDRHFIMLRARGDEHVSGSGQLIEIDNLLADVRARLRERD